MTGFKQLRDGFMESHRHKVLNGFTGAIREAAGRDARVELQPPVGKTDMGDAISVRLIFNGELSGEQLARFEEVVQRFSKPGA